VHIDVGGGVHTWHAVHQPCGETTDVIAGERTPVPEVEHGTQIDVEALGPLAGEHLGGQRPLPHGVDRRTRQRRVAGGGQPTDVARRTKEAGSEDDCGCQLAVGEPVDPCQRIGLLPVPVRHRRRRRQRGDRSVVVEERGRDVVDGRESELVADVRCTVPGVVGVDLIEHVVAELIDIRSAVRGFEWDVVGDERHDPLDVRTHERIPIGAVGYGILGYFWRLTMG
jgi:hypothetical protein